MEIILGKRLKELRAEKGLTQKDLGNLVGVTHNAITQYEKGSRLPKKEILIKICEILEVKIEQFYYAV